MRLDTLLSRGVVCFDGGFGSQLTARAVPFACAEALNLTRPDAVRAIHHDYVRAGAQVVETNTPGSQPHSAAGARPGGGCGAHRGRGRGACAPGGRAVRGLLDGHDGGVSRARGHAVL